MKNKKVIISVFLIIIICFIGVFSINSKPDGSTLKSREEILNNLPKGIEWKISSEKNIEGYIISSINSSNKDGIAVFEPLDNGEYKYQTVSYRDKGDIVIGSAFINQNFYDIYWLNQSDLDYAEITYTVDGKEIEPIQFDIEDLEIIYHKAPSENYSINVTYYDVNGNVIE